MLLSCWRESVHLTKDYSHKEQVTEEEGQSSLTCRKRRCFQASFDCYQWRDIQSAKVCVQCFQSSCYIKQNNARHGPYDPTCWVQEEQPAAGGGGGGGELDVESKGINFDCTRQQYKLDEDTSDGHNHQELHNDHDEASALISSIKACGQHKELLRGYAIHSDLVKEGLLEHNAFIGSALISMYTKCGALKEAQIVFDDIPAQSVVLWSTLIAGYAQNGHGEKALICFEQMQSRGLSPNAITFVSILKACASANTLDKGQQIHAQILCTIFLYNNVVVATSLIYMYAKCGALNKAQELFSELRVRNGISWNALISGYAQHGHGEKALNIYELMQAQGVCPDSVTYTCLLKVCGIMQTLDKGLYIHSQIVRKCMLEQNTVLAGSVIDMYASCGAFARAQGVLDMLQNRSIEMWNALIAGYVQHGQGEEALKCYTRLQHECVTPDAITYVCALKACSNIGAADMGHDIHAQVVRERLLEKNILVACTLIDMYGKNGILEKAQEVFDEVSVRNVVLWNALIAGYAQHGHNEDALFCFEQMLCDGFSPDAVTFACVLKACGSIGALYKGQRAHCRIAALGLLENMMVGTAVVDMYANCGMLAEAKAVFDNLVVRDVVSWGALMVGYAQLGKDDVVFSLFDKMVGEGTMPNSITFLVVLNACSHSGLLERSLMYFEVISKGYGITPTLEHHNSMVDLFGRVGLLDTAIAVIETIPFLANVTLWHTLLGACSKWEQTRLGRQVFKYAVEADSTHGAAFVSMGNICAGASSQNQFSMIGGGVRWKRYAQNKQEHCLWKDLNGSVHSFSAGDIFLHPRSKDICRRLQSLACELSKQGGHLGGAVHSMSTGRFNNESGGHSEMFAIAYALVNTPARTHIHVMKNIQICKLSHSMVALIAKLENRRISIRDAFRLHIFEAGACFCVVAPERIGL